MEAKEIKVISSIQLDRVVVDEIKNILKNPNIEFKVDPSIVGGLIIQMEGSEIDLSISGKLSKLQKLVKNE